MAADKTDIFQDIISLQKEICEKYNAEFMPADLDLFVAIADNVNGDSFPIHGLRLRSSGHSSGWYIWAGDDFLEDPDFFKPVHGKHLIDRCPQAVKFLALPPGYRFVVDKEGNAAAHFGSGLVDN